MHEKFEIGAVKINLFDHLFLCYILVTVYFSVILLTMFD